MTEYHGKPAAVAYIQGRGCIHGRVEFYPHCDGNLIVADLCGLPVTDSDYFGFHIHEGGNCEGAGFVNTGGHYNPGATEHPKHAGDLPPLQGCDGKAYLAVVSNRFRIRDIIGKTVVIHSGPDDFRTQPSGDSGNQIACGVIRRN